MSAGDLITNGKPAPDIFLYAADKFDPKPDPSTCLVFEDAPNGVAAGKAAGMWVHVLHLACCVLLCLACSRLSDCAGLQA